ncbi:MAG: acyl-CoA reductase [Bacteroidetes bacterium]|nr:acyl-CoA reductase [Bacteroidota bacterium]
MTLQTRIEILLRLREFFLHPNHDWQACKERAYRENPWFIPEFVELSVQNIAEMFLNKEALTAWTNHYQIPSTNISSKNIGLVMAGNIPLVGFHDFLCCFITGHKTTIKASSKDAVLIKFIVAELISWEPELADQIVFAENLKGCDAYIATGSNNTSRYFEYYFGKYPHIIRKNRTSVAILDGSENSEELDALSDDIQLYFGLGCRNITKIYVPENYDFLPLLNALRKYEHYIDFHKYKHNYDYHLAILIMSNRYYMNNDSIILTENIAAYSPVSQVNYEKFSAIQLVHDQVKGNQEIQCVVGHNHIPFGAAQSPGLFDYADGIDTMQFLTGL